jgi:hypothetical protein
VRFSPAWWAAWAGVSAVGCTFAAALAGDVAWHFSTIASDATACRGRD